MLIPELLLCCGMSQEVPSLQGDRHVAGGMSAPAKMYFGAIQGLQSSDSDICTSKIQNYCLELNFQTPIQALEIPCGVSGRIESTVGA